MAESPNQTKNDSQQNIQTIPLNEERNLPSIPRINILQRSQSSPNLKSFKANSDNTQLPDLVSLIPATSSRYSMSISNISSLDPTSKSKKSVKSNNSNQYKYTVQTGDTIQSIAIHFDLPVNYLVQHNNIINNLILPGDILDVSPPSVEEMSKDPIHCELLSDDLKEKSQSGTLYLVDNFLNFQADQLSLQPLRIDLVGHIESVIFLHPLINITNTTDINSPDTPMIYMISYFENVKDGNSMTALHFGTNLADATKLKKLVETTALKAQKQVGFIAPDPTKVHLKPKPETSIKNNENQDNNRSDEIEIDIPQDKNLCTQFQIPSFTKIPPLQIGSLPPIDESKLRRGRTMSMITKVQLQGVSGILDDNKVNELRPFLPYYYRNYNWNLLYQLSRDGTSYTTFYKLTEKAKPVVLLIRTDQKEIIGAYISCGLQFSTRYYGNGEIFVFRFNPRIEVFKWSVGKNQYFVCSSKSDISIGGGKATAIWIDGNFLNAVSEACPTFDSPQLTKKSTFKVLDIEVWKIG